MPSVVIAKCKAALVISAMQSQAESPFLLQVEVGHIQPGLFPLLLAETIGDEADLFH